MIGSMAAVNTSTQLQAGGIKLVRIKTRAFINQSVILLEYKST